MKTVIPDKNVPILDEGPVIKRKMDAVRLKPWPNGPKYRVLNIKERDLLYALYEKWNGRVYQIILDKDCQWKSWSQVAFYCSYYHFKDQLIVNKTKKNQEILDRLQDAKMKSIEGAIDLLERRNVFVRNKNGVQLFDKEGKPLIVEQLPFYKEIKTAWEIIKVELGEPTTISKGDITSGGEKITNEINVTFHDFSNENNSE